MATIITVSTAAGLRDALAHATGGETIKLAAGDYGDFALGSKSGFDITFPSNVTITSADPLNPASFTGLNLNGASNLTFDSVVFDYTFKPGDPLYISPFVVGGSDHITIRNSTFEGDVASGMTPADNGFSTGTALSLTGSSNLTIENNEISNFRRGMVVSDCNDVVVARNDVHGLRSDGMDFIQVQGVTIEENYIHDFVTSPDSGDHPDMIQFWTTGTTEPSTDILIRGNVLDIGEGSMAQSIFMRNELVDLGRAGPEMFYRNVIIEDNVITNAHLHGITVGQTAGLTIRQNTVLHADGSAVDGPDGGVEIPAINVAAQSTGVSITGNVTSAVNGWTSQPDWTVSTNTFVQDQTPGAPGYYADMFVSSSLTAGNGAHVYLALPGGVIDSLGTGAQMTRDYLPDPGTVAARFQATDDPGGAVQTRFFDASLCMSDTGTLPAGATFEWSFGDGTTARGMRVAHYFAEGGHYDVALTIRLPSGITDTAIGQVGVQQRGILALGADGVFRASEFGDTVVLPASAFASTAGIQLGGTGVAASVALTHVADIMLAEDFDIAFKLAAGTTTSAGEVFRLHGTMTASITSKGEVQFQAFNDAGSKVVLTSTGLSVTDLKSHDINIRLEDGTLQLWMDGKLASQAAFAGTLKDYAYYDLSFGNPWGGQNFDGDLTAFDIKVGEAGVTQTKTIVSLGLDGIFHIPAAVSAAAALAEAPAAAAEPVGLHLGDVGLAARVASTNLDDLMVSKQFDISMTLDADMIDSTGAVFRLDGGMIARVLANGQLAIRAFGADGEKVGLVSRVNLFDDLKAHDIDIHLQDGKLQLWVDSSLAAERDFAGTLVTSGTHNLDFGLRDANRNFDGHLTAFDITVVDTAWSGAAAALPSDWSTPSAVVL